MYSEMHLWCYNINNYCMKHSKKWGVHSFQIDGQAFTSSYWVTGSNVLSHLLLPPFVYRRWLNKYTEGIVG